MEEDAEETRQADEAAEGDGVEEAEPQRIQLAQDAERSRADASGAGCFGLSLAHRKKTRPASAIGSIAKPDRGLPAVGRGQARHEERRQHGAGVAGAGDAHHQALVLRRIPARGERQRHGEAGAGHAEQQRDHEQRGSESATSQPSSSGTKVSAMPISPVRRGPR